MIDEYSEAETVHRREAATKKKMPATPPKPQAHKSKPSHVAPATKAERAALKRIDKMVIKRMRKR